MTCTHEGEIIVVFLLQMLEEQLQQERRRTTLDFSDRDFKMKSEYEKRLKSELKGLRKKYRQETERTKNEFMNLHLKQVTPQKKPCLIFFRRLGTCKKS